MNWTSCKTYLSALPVFTGPPHYLKGTGAADTDPSLSQTLTGLTVGTSYLLRGQFNNLDSQFASTDFDRNFAIDLDGVQQQTFANLASAWFNFNLRFTATATSHTIRLRAEIDGSPTAYAVDNLSVRALMTQQQLSCANTGTTNVQLAATDARGDLALATTTVTVVPTTTPSVTWTGAASTDWTNCANWTYGQVPSASVSVVIPAGLTRYPTTGGGVMSVRDFTLDAGAVVTGTLPVLQVYGDFLNKSSSFTAPTLVRLMGSGSQNISGPTSTAFNALEVNKPGGTVQLAQSIAVNTALTLTAGQLSTGSYRLTLGPTATIAETEMNRVTGWVETTRAIASGTREAFGNLGLALTRPAASPDPGATRVVRVTGTALAGAGSTTSIQRYYDISPTTNAGLNMTLEFGYFDQELNGLPKATLALVRSTTGTAGPWVPRGYTTRSATANTVTLTGIDAFSTWTLGTETAPLPVVLTDFTAALRPDQTAVRLAWHTASEKNSAWFDVERSPDGVAFGPIGRVAAAGTSTLAHAYTLLDGALPPAALVLYYRLRQLDLDGTATYSPVRVVALGSPATQLTLFPNPTQATATLLGAAAGGVVQVYDALGRLVLTTAADATGTAYLALPAGLPAGVYVVRANSQAVRLTVE